MRRLDFSYHNESTVSTDHNQTRAGTEDGDRIKKTGISQEFLPVLVTTSKANSTQTADFREAAMDPMQLYLAATGGMSCLQRLLGDRCVFHQQNIGHSRTIPV